MTPYIIPGYTLPLFAIIIGIGYLAIYYIEGRP